MSNIYIMHLNHFALEEFIKPTISSYLISRKDTNILNYICQDSLPKIEITKYIVASVKKRDKSYFPTHFHVKWVMECIGFAFSLPIEYYSTISQAIDIYRNWLDLGNESRPLPIEENEGFYQREMIGHLSLLFVERNGDMHKHAELCKDVLFLIKDLCRQKKLEKETWHHLLKIILIITGGLLKNNTVLVKEIAPLLFKTMFEAWLRSNTRETELWEELNKYMAQWINNIWIIYHWIAVEAGLTKSIIDLIYGKEKSKLRIFFRQLPKPFEIDPELVTISINKEQVIYFWHQFLQIVSRNTLSKIPTDADICKELVKSFAILTDEFINFSKSRNSKSKIEFIFNEESGNSLIDQLLAEYNKAHQKFVDGEWRVPVPRINSILSIFGNWLFAYANCDYLYCEKGRAKAIGALCRIFSSNLGPVSLDNAGKFYKTIFYIMKGGVSTIVIKNIIKYSTSLLSCDIPGIRILLDKDYLFKAIAIQLNDKKAEWKLRRYCYEIISCFVGCVNYLNNQEVIKSLLDILLDSVQNETDSGNFIKVIWIISTFIATLQYQNELIHNIVMALTNRLKNITNDKMYLDLLCVLSTIPFLLCNKSASSEATALKVNLKLCSYVQKKHQNAHENIVISLLYCIRKWIACFPETVNDFKFRSELLKVLTCVKLIERYTDLSLYMEEFITCRVGKRQTSISISPISECAMPQGLFSNYNQEYRNFMIFNDTLISLHGTENEIIGVFRNKIGKTIWKINSKFSTINSRENKICKMDTVVSKLNPIEIDQAVDMSECIDESEEEILEKLKILQIKQKNSLLTKVTKQTVQSNSTLKEVAQESSRNFLANLGFFDYEQLSNITQVYAEIVNPSIHSLDTFSENEVFFLPVIYLNSSTSLDILTNSDCYSYSFQCLLKQLGVLLDSRHLSLGFLTHIQMALEKYRALLYISDGLHEILSIVPCLSEGSNSLQDVVGASPVIAIWNEHIDDKFCIFQPNLLQYPELEHKICILLYPVNEKLVKVKFYPSKEQPGPLIENMIIPLDILGKLLQYTLINIYGDSLETVTTRRNRQNLLEQLELLGKNEEIPSKRFNSILNYSFNLEEIIRYK